MALLHVTCVDHRPSDNSHRGILMVGGRGWSTPAKDVIENIMEGKNTYFIDVDGQRSFLSVVHSKPPYLQAHAGGVLNDDLLMLDSCPIDIAEEV